MIVLNPFWIPYAILVLKNIGLTPGIPKGCFQHPQDVVHFCMYLHTFYVLFQTSFTIKSGVTDVAWKRFDIFMLDFNVFFEIAKTWGFVPAYMTNMKFTFFWMRVFFVLFQAVFQGMSKIALVAFPGFLCFMFIHYMLL